MMVDKQTSKLSKRTKKEYQRLSDDVMSFATQGRMTLDLLQDISTNLMDFTASQAVEIAYTERDRIFHSDARASENPAFFCNTISAGESQQEALSSILRISPDSIDKSSHFSSECAVLWNRGATANGDFPSVLRLTILIGGNTRGLILVGFSSAISVDESTKELLEGLCRTLGLALSHNQAQFELRERVKELACMYGIANFAVQGFQKIGKLLENIVRLLPPAWLYPEITEACITLDGHHHATSGFVRTEFIQEAEIVVNDAVRGKVEIAYRESRPELDEGPFLAEERHLIDSIAHELALIIQRREAEKEQQRLSEQLQHAERLATIGQLAAGIAHELNEPLTGILGFAELLNDLEGLPEQAVGDIVHIESAALHAREIVRKLLLFSRQVPTRSEKVNVNTIIRDVIAFFQARLTKASIRIEMKLFPDLPSINADPAQIRQIVVNLVVNAAQAMSGGGCLSLKTDHAEEYIRMEVADNGIGMAKDIISKIYVPFFTTKDVNEGTGLGLSVVHGIIKAHYGRIEVESTPGVGTKFTIHLPVEQVTNDK